MKTRLIPILSLALAAGASAQTTGPTTAPATQPRSPTTRPASRPVPAATQPAPQPRPKPAPTTAPAAQVPVTQPLADRIASIEALVRLREREMAEAKAHLRESLDRLDVSSAAITAAAARLDELKQSLELDSAAAEARASALEAAIAKRSAAAQKQVQSDALSKELEIALEARQKIVDRLKSANRGDAELDDALTNLAEARARLLARRDEVLRAAGGELLSRWAEELDQLTIEREERTAKLEAIRQQRHRLAAALPRVEAVDKLQRDLSTAREQLLQAQTALQSNAAADR